jgi:hypothetical protein
VLYTTVQGRIVSQNDTFGSLKTRGESPKDTFEIRNSLSPCTMPCLPACPELVAGLPTACCLLFPAHRFEEDYKALHQFRHELEV